MAPRQTDARGRRRGSARHPARATSLNTRAMSPWDRSTSASRPSPTSRRCRCAEGRTSGADFARAPPMRDGDWVARPPEIERYRRSGILVATCCREPSTTARVGGRRLRRPASSRCRNAREARAVGPRLVERARSKCVTGRAARLDPMGLLVDLAHEVLEGGGDLIPRSA
jgi:hypothetical protein